MLILLLLLVGGILLPLAIGSYYYMKNLGGCTKDPIITEGAPVQYLITKENRQEVQVEVKSSGYAAAYVMRHFGKEAAGYEVYREFPAKMDNGYVAPKQLLTYFGGQGFRADLYEGTIETLKKRLSQGVPVIVLIMEALDATFVHYVAAVGYDKNYIYLVDSMEYLKNEESPYYNRKVTIKEFQELWEIQFPYIRNIYVVVK